MKIRLVFFLSLLMFICHAQEIIPYPNGYTEMAGQFKVPGVLSVSASDSLFAMQIPGFIAGAHKYSSVKIKETKGKAQIRLVKNKKITGTEAYSITIGQKQVTVEAGSANGCFYGLQSLLQLLINSGANGAINCATIHDSPRYEWRGLMLDESRHFFGTGEVKKILDMMALHKLNKFHWHLTDVPGWRIEIKQYPLLATVGATGNHTDPGAAPKYYSQREIQEIVAYAAERFIEIIPEIDMPGHATAAVKAYPEFSGGGSVKFPDFTFNPGKEGTYGFLTNILEEVSQLFPSRYIHIGGDEVHFGNEHWNHLPEVGQLSSKHGLSSLVEVEHYFLNRMADSIKTLGKTVVGWDEVVTAGLPSHNTLVMWWRHDKPDLLRQALNSGYEVVLCPRIPLYFDFVQHGTHSHGRKWAGLYATIEQIYGFPGTDIIEGSPVSNKLIKGIQANVWTETIHTPERLQFMVYPRISALSESAWTHERMKNQPGFFSRLEHMVEVYKKEGLVFFDYRNPENSPEPEGPENPE